MGGGLLNLVAYGNLNVIVNGNPTKTFFKTTYAKYTNFGLQKFRLDYIGLKTLQINNKSTFTFKVERYADLFLDTYLVVKLPHIWSPIITDLSGTTVLSHHPYEFKWIKNLGSQMIKKVRFLMGGHVIQEFTGQYIYNLVERDFSKDKKNLFYEMTGNVPELNDPANYANRNGNYPNAWGPDTDKGVEPSIRERTLYIPLNLWSTLSSKMAIPLTSLQYTDFRIEIELRPIQELYITRNVLDKTGQSPEFINILNNEGQLPQYKAPYISPSNTSAPTNAFHQNESSANSAGTSAFEIYRFTHPPPKEHLNGDSTDGYNTSQKIWNADIHLISTYAFLSDEEQLVFASKPQKYLVKQVHERLNYNLTGNKRTEISSLGLITSWMWYFQRSDVGLRNEWSNYTNWPYDYIPACLTTMDLSNLNVNIYPEKWWTPLASDVGSDCSCNNPSRSIKITGPYHEENEKHIMKRWGLLFDGKDRENEFPRGVYNLIEKYVRTAGNSELDLYCYNFCLNTDPFNFQPNGAVNLSKFSKIEFETSTISPPKDLLAKTFVICDSVGDTDESQASLSAGQEGFGGVPIGVNKATWNIYKYNYNMYVMEERYNVLVIESGIGGLMFAR